MLEDFHSVVFGVQFSNVAAYMGYMLTSKVGYRQETKYFEEGSRAASTIFVQVFAGVE